MPRRSPQPARIHRQRPQGAERVVIEAQDANMKAYTFEAHGFEAVVIQHEIDHLDGILFLDRIVDIKTDLFRAQSSAGGKNFLSRTLTIGTARVWRWRWRRQTGWRPACWGRPRGAGNQDRRDRDSRRQFAGRERSAVVVRREGDIRQGAGRGGHRRGKRPRRCTR